MSDLGVISRGDVLVRGSTIAEVGPNLVAPADARVIECNGRVLLPGFVDCHTHACWSGDRLEEWEMKRRGVPYLEILARGGGILSTVRSVRAATEDELVANTLARLNAMLRCGTTTVEVKSGYGLDLATELKMLRAIKRAAAAWSGTVVPTALLGHAIEGDPESFVARTIEETLPTVSAEFPGITIDAFCETAAWMLPACERLFRRAIELGHPIRVHADQFNSLGMTSAAVRLRAVSVDHLEASSPEDVAALAASETFGVMLPVTGFHTDGRYADGRGFVDQGGALAIATNCNPGSAPSHAMPFALGLSVRFLGLAPAEAITAATANGAALLGLADRGRMVPGGRADLILLHERDERMLCYEVGGNPIHTTIVGGRVVGS